MNRKKIISVIAVILAVLMLMMLVVSVIPARAFAVSQADIDALEQKKDDLTAQQEASQQRIEELQEQQASVMEQKRALDERNTLAMAQLELVREQVQLYSQLIQEKAAEVEAARKVEEAQLERYRTRVRAMEENGSFDILSLLLHVDSFASLLGAIDDIGLIMQKDQELEQAYIDARTAHEQVQAEYEEIKAELEQHQAELEAEQLEVAKMLAEAMELLISLEQDIDKATEEYEAAERAREEADAQIAALYAELERQRQAELERQRELERQQQQQQQQQQQSGSSSSSSSDSSGSSSSGGSGGSSSSSSSSSSGSSSSGSSGDSSGGGEQSTSPSAIGTGSLAWPVPCSHTVTSRFGTRVHPITGEVKSHTGMDIDGYNKDGYPIVACDNGTVIRASWYGGYGNCVIIDHGNGMQTLYGHMSGYAVSEGDIVSRGQTIGYLGATGTATGTHCHLEISINGSRVDPENYFSGITFYDC